jgi:uncharacterized protein YhaN
MGALSVLTAVLLVGQPADKELPPLSEEQVAKLRKLVRVTQEAAAMLQAQLDEAERALAAVYAEYELDERKAVRLQNAIVDLQRQKLANYHKMQTELRTIVGRERFDVLKQRLKLVFGTPPTRPKEPAPATKP